MRLYIGEGSQGEFFYARMYDEKYQLVAEEEVQIPTEGLPCYVEMPMDLDMEKDKTYFFTLQGVDLVAEARQGEEVRVCFAYEMMHRMNCRVPVLCITTRNRSMEPELLRIMFIAHDRYEKNTGLYGGYFTCGLMSDGCGQVAVP